MYSSRNTTRVTKSRIRWVGHWNAWGKGKGVYSVSWENLRKTDHEEGLDVDGRVKLKCTFKKEEGDVKWIDLAKDREGLRDVLDTIMEPSVSIKGRVFLD